MNPTIKTKFDAIGSHRIEIEGKNKEGQTFYTASSFRDLDRMWLWAMSILIIEFGLEFSEAYERCELAAQIMLIQGLAAAIKVLQGE